jgi:hypothetical protein
MWDMSDQFVAEAETGGLLALILFVALISKCFGRLGTMRKRVAPERQWLLWCLGSVMLAHIFAYFGVAYWDQTQIWWFAFLAMISAATIPPRVPAARARVSAGALPVSLPEVEKISPVDTGAVVYQRAGKMVRPWSGQEL